MVEIRPYDPDDLDDLYRICLACGSAGADASRLYRDPKLLGHVYAAPYGVLRPACALVAEDAEGVGGYILGADDTRAFEARLEAEWWPPLRSAYPEPPIPAAERTPDERLIHVIHHPPQAPAHIVDTFPAHLHIDLLPRLQGRGLGRRLMDAWLALVTAMGARGIHLDVGTANRRAQRFYQAYGLEAQTPPTHPGVITFARRLTPTGAT